VPYLELGEHVPDVEPLTDVVRAGELRLVEPDADGA
jgi:hypothetical protein